MTSTIAELNDSLVGRYLVEKEVGQGGMATVYLARDVRHDRRVAIKVLHPELAAVLGPERFVTEMKVTANLQHPHILPLFDSGTARNQLFYVMPFVEGESLRDRLQREQQLPIDEAIRITTEVASALDYAHRHGVVHRDIKPENILLHDGTALVADFGIALAVSNAGGTRLTQTGLSLGTPQYMSPEQATGDKNIDGRTDVYSLGCVLYEMLTGEPPFTGPSSQAIVARVLTEQVRPIRARRDTVPQGVEDAVLKAVQKLPADRFATPSGFAEALREAKLTQATRGVVAHGDGRSRLVSRRGAFVTLVACAGVAVLTYAVTRWISGRSAGSPSYVGELLSGPTNALFPRVSPDGKTIAFAAMEGLQTQVAVLTPASGDWKTLTHDTTKGFADGFAWSPDGSRIYYERFLEVPRGIYSISPLGGDNRLVLPDAGGPIPLPDGSVLAWKLSQGGRGVLLHYRPDVGKLDSLPAFATYGNGRFGDLLRGGRELVFLGTSNRFSAVDTLFAMNIATKKMRVISATLRSRGGVVGAPAVTPDGSSVLVVTTRGDQYQVTAVATDGSDRQSVLLNTTTMINTVSMAQDGTLYLDQEIRPYELDVFDPHTGNSERTPLPVSLSYLSEMWPLPDGRLLAVEASGGRHRVMALAPGKDPVPLVARAGATTYPAALLGTDRVVVRARDSSAWIFAIVRSADGSVVGRLADLTSSSIAGSPDGTTVFFADSGAIWKLPVAGGTRQWVAEGNSVAVDPNGRYVVTRVSTADSVRLMYVPLDGTPPHEILVRGPLRIASTSGLTPNAVAADGRIVVTVVSPGSWFFPAAILDPATGALSVLKPGFAYDTPFPGWDGKGRVVGVSAGLQASLWRFRPEKAK